MQEPHRPRNPAELAVERSVAAATEPPGEDSRGRRWASKLASGFGRMRWMIVAFAVLAMAWPFWTARRDQIAGDHRIGPVDGSAYALQARSLASGRGWRIPYVINFYHRYDPSVWKRDDQWPPGPAFILAPVFRRHGPDAARGRAAMVFVATIVLPLAGAWLACAATHRTWPGLVAAGLLLSSSLIAHQGSSVLGDVPVTALFAAYLAALVSSRRHPAWLVVAGLLGGAAYYMKGSQVLLLPMLPGLAVVLHGFRILISRWLFAGIAAYLAVVGPWWMANLREYGNPLHSTQNYVASFFGLSRGTWDGWDTNFYGVHWGHNLPRRSDRFRDLDLWTGSVRRNAEAYARTLLLGPDARAPDWEKIGPVGIRIRDQILHAETPTPQFEEGEIPNPFSAVAKWPSWPFTLVQTTGLAFGLLGLAGLLPVMVVQSLPRLRPRPGGFREVGRLGCERIRTGAALLLALLAQALFVSVMWLAMDRFTLLVLPPAIGLGLMGLFLIPDAVAAFTRPQWTRWVRRVHPGIAALGPTVATVLACAVGLWIWTGPSARIRAAQTPARPRAPDAEPTYPGQTLVARALEPVLPADAVIMARYPLGILFAGPDTWKAVGLPHAEPPVLFSIARYYGVTHLLHDRDRPGLREFIRTHPEAMERMVVPDSRRLNLYRIHYDRFPEGFFLDPDQIGRTDTTFPTKSSGPPQTMP